MTDRPIFLVTGATGAQGGSVARHLLAVGKHHVRALTRNPASEAATALAASGAEVVSGDLDRPDSLRAALSGARGVFGVTNFWEHFDKEEQQGRNLIDAVAAAGVEDFIFSALPSPNAVAPGKFDVPHFEIKARLADRVRELGLGATFVHVAFYYENFLSFFPPQRQEDGSYAFGFPQGDTPLASVAAEDLGGVVTAILKDRSAFRDRIVGAVGDELTGTQYAEVMSRVLGRRIVYNYIPREVFAGFGFPGAADLADMFEFNRLHIPTRKADVDESRRLYPAMQGFEAWLEHNKTRFDAILG